jgi:hypothetical protein
VAIFCAHLFFLQERTYIKNLQHDVHHYAIYLVICYVISLRSTLHSNTSSNSLSLLQMWSFGLWNYAVLQMDIKISEEYVMPSAWSKCTSCRCIRGTCCNHLQGLCEIF